MGSPWNLGHNREVWITLIDGVGLRPLDDSERTDPKFDHCYWQHQTTVIKMGVILASFDYFSFNESFVSGEDKFTEPYRLSKNLEDAMASEIMFLYPSREITAIVMLTVVLPLAILGPLMIGFCCVKRKRDRVSVSS